MKKGLAILLILSCIIQASGGDDAVGIATYQDLSQDFARLFDDQMDTSIVTRPRSQSTTDSVSPRNSKMVTRVKSSSSASDDEMSPIMIARALELRQRSLERIRQRSQEYLLTRQSHSNEQILVETNEQDIDSQQRQQQQEDSQ